MSDGTTCRVVYKDGTACGKPRKSPQFGGVCKACITWSDRNGKADPNGRRMPRKATHGCVTVYADGTACGKKCDHPTHFGGICGACYAWSKNHNGADPNGRKRAGKSTEPCIIVENDERCTEESHCQAMCKKHYSRWQRHGDPLATNRIRNNGAPCIVVENGARCTNEAVRNRMCNAHYLRDYRHGDVHANALPNRIPGAMQAMLARGANPGTEDCIPFLDAHGRRATVKLEGVSMFGSRAAWIIAHGDPGDLHVLHTCNGGSGEHGCINVRHLRLGTPDENSKDMVNSEQQAWGERARHAKLTEEQVLEIRRRYKPYERVNNGNALAREFGVSRATITCIVTGQTWKPLWRD